MLDVFGAFKAAIKFNEICVDNYIFRFHYKATFLFLIVASILVTSKQYIGDPIDCINYGNIPNNVMDTYCWIHSTFTVTNQGSRGFRPGTPLAHVGPVTDQSQSKYHRYYQWVPFVLFFQAIFFYVPRFLWKIWEGHKMKSLSADLNGPIVDQSTRENRQKLIIEYLSCNLRSNNIYTYRFFFCELLNFINVVTQIFLTDKFLGNDFIKYGIDIVSLSNTDPEDRNDTLAHVFPTITKCTFHKFGTSGTIENIDGLCVLPVNIINEKIYIFFWFWFIILAVISGLGLLYRLAIIFYPSFRFHVIRRKAIYNTNHQIESITNRCQIGDWFLLMLLGDNLNSSVYKEIICEMAERFEHKAQSEIDVGKFNPVYEVAIPDAKR